MNEQINGTNPSAIVKDVSSQCMSQLYYHRILPVCRAPKRQWKVHIGPPSPVIIHSSLIWSIFSNLLL